MSARAASSNSPAVELKLSNLPESPGVYLFKNAQGKIIYIGKAKNLRNRVRSYFQDSHRDTKTTALVAQVADFRTDGHPQRDRIAHS